MQTFHEHSRLEVTVGRSPAGPITLTLSGQIDERARLVDLVAHAGDAVVFDLDLVTFVNSAGVAAWTELLRVLRARKVKVGFRRCSEAVVNQMNMVAEVRGGATIESFFCPYACRDCAHEQSLCIDVTAHRAALRRHEPPLLPCPRCKGGAMEFTELPERYLQFLDG